MSDAIFKPPAAGLPAPLEHFAIRALAVIFAILLVLGGTDVLVQIHRMSASLNDVRSVGRA